MKVVLDANTLVSAYIIRKGISGQIILNRARYIGVATEEILQEVHHSLHYERIRTKYQWSEQSVGTFLATVRKDFLILKAPPPVHVVRDDPDDDKYFACAKQAKAEYIVSKDRHVTTIGEWKGIRVIKPRQFLEILKERYPSQLD
jgi:uncharacterized protein